MSFFLRSIKEELLEASDLYDTDITVEEVLAIVEDLQVAESEVSRLRKQNERYEKALEFYAREKTYERRYDPYEPLDTDINDDRGALARKVLGYEEW